LETPLRRTPFTLALSAVALLALSACSGSPSQSVPSAGDIVSAFEDAGITITDPRDNTDKGWCDADQFDCDQYFTTEEVTVITGPSAEAVERFTAGDMGSAYYVAEDGSVALSFLAQGTPKEARAPFVDALESYLAD
jgi:hypothetical protein